MRQTVVGGADQSYAIDEDGCIWGFGLYTSGVQQITSGSEFPRMVAAAAGCNHALFLDDVGRVWGIGENGNYQLGMPADFKQSKTPILIPLPFDKEIVGIACGDFHSLLLDATGAVWASGYNISGQVGRPKGEATSQQSFMVINNLNRIREVRAASLFSLFLDEDGKVWTCGEFPKGTSDSNLRVINVPPIKEMAAGVYFCLLVDFEGAVWGTGVNDHGQLGPENNGANLTPTKFPGLPPIRLCSAGWNFSIFLGEDDSLWTSGCNTYGTLCNGTNVSHSTAQKIEAPPLLGVSCGWNHCLLLDYDGNVWCCGEAKKLTFKDNFSISSLTRIPFPKLIMLMHSKPKNVKSARNIKNSIDN